MAISKRGQAAGRQPQLPTLIKAYQLACRAEGKSTNTLRWYEQKLRAFLDFLVARSLSLHPSSVSGEIARAFAVSRQTRGISAFTVRGYVQVLKGFYTWLTNEGYLDSNPLLRVKLPKTPVYVVKPLEEDDVRGLLAKVNNRTALGSRDLTLLLLLLDTGIRLGEVAGLTVSEADRALRDGVVRVLGKGARERLVPVGFTCQRELRRYLDLYRPQSVSQAIFLSAQGQPLTAEGIRQVVKRVASRAGMSGVHPHRLRHTAAITFLRGGGDVFALQRILGHSTLSMTRNYVMLADSDVKAVHLRASPADRLYGRPNAKARSRS